jgi:hypothetical protein
MVKPVCCDAVNQQTQDLQMLTDAHMRGIEKLKHTRGHNGRCHDKLHRELKGSAILKLLRSNILIWRKPAPINLTVPGPVAATHQITPELRHHTRPPRRASYTKPGLWTKIQGCRIGLLR